ncbi:MAG: phosphatidate cytidylyltransferase [Bacillota bacterium]|nr:phosphatidate cytidylyltransferase [Bacillota bacterium]
MKTRVLSGLIMLPLLILIILNGYVLYAGCFLLSIMAIYEFFRGFKELDVKPSLGIAVSSTAALYLLGILNHIAKSGASGQGIKLGAISLSDQTWIMIWIFASVLACLLYLFNIDKRKLDDAMVTITGIFYVSFFCYHLGALGLNKELNILVWLAVITAFGTDICAYFAGVTLGKHKLCPVISPKKTWEGAIGGVLGTMILTGIFGFFFAKPIIIHCLIMGLLGSVISMFGDLTASIFKRKMGIKDYGNLIPGHGGILDRFDSVLFTSPLIYYYATIVLSGTTL